MRTFSTTVQQIINSGNIKFFYLIELNFSNDYYLTSYASDITLGGNTYQSESGLFEIESPKLSTVVDREAYRVVLTDFNDEMSAEFKANVIGKDIHVRIGLIDTNNNPLLNSNDLIEVYKGTVDTPTISIDWENKTAVIEGTSPMADLDSVNSFISSKSGMDQKSSTDTSFDNIFQDSEATLKWGKV
jgi:hypothetical protein